MNTNRLLNMVLRQLTRKLVNKDLKGSVDAASRRRGASAPAKPNHTSRSQETAMRALRRITRL
jgi:hypothetical protein